MLASALPVHDLAAYQALTAWYQTPLGQHLLQREQQLLDELLQRRFGYHLLQLGCSALQLYEQSPMGHKFAFTPFPQQTTGFHAIADADALPLAADSVDCVLLHHALDFTVDQHQLLREVTRVLIPGGHVVIVGFNPFSSWGLRSKLSRGSHKQPWRARMLSSSRLSDWLKLLEFHIDELRYCEYALPWSAPTTLRYTRAIDKWAARINWPTGAAYVIAARKQVVPLIPIQRQRRRSPVSALTMPLPKPSATRGQQLPDAAREQS